MSRGDASLGHMIARLASMPESDRTFVLDRLGPEARAKLAPQLTQDDERYRHSSELQTLIDRVRAGNTAAGMTPNAVRALLSAVQQPRPAKSPQHARKQTAAARVATLVQRAMS